MGGVSKKVYAILSSAGDDGRKIIDMLGRASQEEVDKALDDFFKNNHNASVEAFDDDTEQEETQFDGDYNDVDIEIESFLDKATKNEPAITNHLKEIGCNLVGLDFRLKKIDSLKRKVNTIMEETGDTVSNVLSNIKDAVRFTSVDDENNLTEHVKTIVDKLRADGYKLSKFKNNFKRDDYRDINANFISPDGQVFELQFNTPAGLEAKEKYSHPIYEKIRVMDKNDPRRKNLEEELTRVWQNIPIPRDIKELNYDLDV